MVTKMYLIDLKAPRKNVVNKLKRLHYTVIDKDNQKLALQFFLFALAASFTGLCSIATQINPFTHEINTMSGSVDLFNNFSRESIEQLFKRF